MAPPQGRYALRALQVALAFAALSACREPAAPKPVDAGAPAPKRRVPLETAVSAVRCAECHEIAERTWQTSAHARAAISPFFTATRATAVEPASCDRCHAPLRGRIADDDPVAQQGVTCDVCHTIREAKAERTGGAFVLELADNVKYGPLCDAKDHYFHKMGCSPLHAGATLCGSCHLLYRQTEGGALPVYTEFEEWQRSSFASAEMPCQSCHMEGKRGEVAVGAGEREAVHTHGLLGLSGELRRQALSLKVTVRDEGGKLRVDAVVENREAGHFVPSGVPGRQVVLEVRALGADGRELDRAERTYARVLVDEGGAEVPWHQAVKVARDDRLPPGEPRESSFLLEGGASGQIVARLLWRQTSPELARALKLEEVREEQLARVQVPFGAAGPRGGRRLLPRTVEVTP